jgi:hypothetical protein
MEIVAGGGGVGAVGGGVEAEVRPDGVELRKRWSYGWPSHCFLKPSPLFVPLPAMLAHGLLLTLPALAADRLGAIRQLWKTTKTTLALFDEFQRKRFCR